MFREKRAAVIVFVLALFLGLLNGCAVAPEPQIVPDPTIPVFQEAALSTSPEKQEEQPAPEKISAPKVEPISVPILKKQEPLVTQIRGDSYINSDGQRIPSPVHAVSVPEEATARCRDGTYSFSQHRSGTCSHHGGVAEWL